MSKTTYTTIPDTSDTAYWELKAINTKERSKTFVPRYRKLHRQLLEQQREDSLARRSRQKQTEGYRRYSANTNKNKWV